MVVPRLPCTRSGAVTATPFSPREAGVAVFFDLPQLYYLTQYWPVCEALRERGVRCHFVAYHAGNRANGTGRHTLERLGVPFTWVSSPQQASELYRQCEPDWVVFGQVFAHLDQLASRTRSAQLYHGIGMKSDIYSAGLYEMDVRFTEGPHYTRVHRTHAPRARLIEVGYAKLDPLFWPNHRQAKLKPGAIGLQPGRPTLMYAPSFFPSSIGAMPDNWPRDFADCNLIIKAHEYSHTGARSYYRAQRRKLARWAQEPNVHLVAAEQFDPIPYMTVSDVLISEASSVLFEFAAMDRPVVWCDFLALRWTYRGPFRHRLAERLDSSILPYADIAAHARSYQEMVGIVREQIAVGGEGCARRRTYTAELLGPTDGRTGERIAQFLLTGSVR